MEHPVVERYLLHGTIDENQLLDMDWENNILTLGFLLGNSKAQLSRKVLDKISDNASLNPALRGYCLMKILEALGESLKRIREEDKDLQVGIITDFLGLSRKIQMIKNEMGCLKENLAKTYTKGFTDILKKCLLNKKTPLLGICAHINKDILTCECSLTFYSPEELQKLSTAREIEKYDILQIIQKGCEHILLNRIKGNEYISISTYIALNEVLHTAQFIPSDLGRIESALVKFKDNFTPKQKASLINQYQYLCDKLGCAVSNDLVSRYRAEAGPREDRPYKPESALQEERPYRDQARNYEEKKAPSSSQGQSLPIKQQFRNFFMNYKKSVKSRETIDVQSIITPLRELIAISQYEVYNELLRFANNEYIDEYSSLLWKLMSKALSKGQLLSQEQRHAVNASIDEIIAESGKRRKRY